MKKLYFLSIYFTIFITFFAQLSFLSVNVPAQTQVTSPSKTSPGGVSETLLTVAAGRLRIYLPDDIRPGDKISGSVTAEPTGKTEAERARNAAELKGYAVEIAGTQQNAWEQVGKNLQSTIKFALNAGATPTGSLRSKAGNPISNFNIPVSSVGITNPSTSPPTPEDFKLPTIGQQGRPVQIQGPFDGNFDNTSVRVGGQPVEPITESPRASTFRSPENVTGPTEIAMKEGEVAKSAPFRNLELGLTAPKTNLSKGEATKVTVEVNGLQGITTPVAVQLVTTGPVNMSGGNLQNILILPGKVNPEGMFTQSFNLTATQAGGFSVTATVLDPEAQEARCKCTCALNDPPILGAGRDKIKGGGTTYSYKTSIKTATCEGENCTVVLPYTYAWSVVAADSTATYKVQDATNASDKFKVDVTGPGTLAVTVTVTVKCSDGTKCSETKTKTFDVKK